MEDPWYCMSTLEYILLCRIWRSHKLKQPQVMSNFRKYCTETCIAAIMQRGCSKYFFGS